MPVPKLDDNLLEYSFSKEEYRAARVLTQLQIYLLHTKRAQLMKIKAAELIPDDPALTRPYITRMCEIDGKMAQIQEMLDDHTAALNELNDPGKNEQGVAEQIVDSVEQRANDLVHKQP